MVGDSTSDVQAALAAGIPSIMVRGGYTSVPAEQLGADAIIDDMTGLVGALERLEAARLSLPICPRRAAAPGAGPA